MPANQPSDWQSLRRKKLEDLAQLGLPFHPTRFEPTHKSTGLREGFEDLEGNRVCVAGRLVADNRMGKASFLRLLDDEGRLQLYIKRDAVPQPLWEYYRLLDLGDIIGACGKLFKTRTEEVTVEIDELVLLQKSYLPLPEKFHGLQDVERRYRQRYLDLISNQESRDIVRARARIVSAIREFLDTRGFIEVETPILQPLYGGGAAEPFVTHVAHFDQRAYLRIAVELYLKRLIVGGLDRVYEMGKDFRNESFSRKHSQEFTMLELYQAYADYGDMMRLLEELVSAAAQAAGVGPDIRFDEHDISVSPPWERIRFRDAVKKHAGLDLEGEHSRDDLLAYVRAEHIVVSDELSKGAVLDQIWSAKVEPHLIQPTFVIDYPIDFPGSTFARKSPRRADEVERFEAFIGGVELANAFTEVNDAFEQRERMDALSATEGALTETDEVDFDFLTALEHGMAPTGGLGLGIDRLVMVLMGADHVRETILFPLLKRKDEAEA